MKQNKKKSVIVVFAILIVVAAAFFGTLYYITSTKNSYTYSEKKWINDNINTSFDIYVEPSLPVFSKNGSGVFYDYIKAFKEDTGLNINIITANTSKTRLVNKTSLDENDIVVYKDHYVILSETDNVNKLSDLIGKKLGVLTGDKSNLSYYLTEYTNISISEYSSFDALINAYDAKQINYIIVPMYKYIDEISTSDFNIVFHLDGLSSFYCLDLEDENETLNSILSKFYSRYKNKSNENIKEYFLNIYYSNMHYTEMQKESITNEDFIVGYINNLPFEGMIHNDFTGLTNTYLEKFADMTGVTYKYVEYKDTKSLTSALSDKKVDIVLNYYSLSNNNYSSSRTLGSSDYVVLAHINNNIAINSLYSLTNNTVTMLNNMNLKYSMASKNLFEIKDYASVNSLVKNVDEDSIIIVEKEVYDYFKDSSLKDYSIRYFDSVRLNNSFLLNKDNEAFNNLFDFYLSTLSTNEVKNESVEGVIDTLKNNRFISFIIDNIVYILIALAIIATIVYSIVKKIMNDKKTKKEDRLYYFDAMTNLKNRNYLNDNIDFWSSTKVYPQAIIVIDINKLKALNDKDGHEAGDNQIKAVASVLIKTQRDNSEIMRTDGDEFIVYLVGHDEKKIGTYIHKLNRELANSLPNKDYGVSIGYSMILNEEMTIDDAINDSLNMINKAKGQNKNER